MRMSSTPDETLPDFSFTNISADTKNIKKTKQKQM